MNIPQHSALVIDKVRFQGDAVSAVVTDSRGQAEDALEAIDVENEQLPAVVDTEKIVAVNGKVVILKCLAVDDCGRVINPLLKDGQVHGGVAQGI